MAIIGAHGLGESPVANVYSTTTPLASPMNAHIAPEDSRSLRLKAATRDSHGALDKRIMAGDIFADRSNFARFLRVQYRFHRSIDALYANPALDALLPDLGERRRLTQVARDLQDLEQTLPGRHRGVAVRSGTARRVGVAVRGRRLQPRRHHSVQDGRQARPGS
jgi:hypothetical protein